MREGQLENIFKSLKSEAYSFNQKRIHASLSSYNMYNRLLHNHPSKEFESICRWRMSTYSLTGKIKTSSILFKIFKRQTFTNRELALAESFAQWLGTYVGQSYIQSKTNKKSHNEYGEVELPRLDYIVLTQLTGKDYMFLDSVAYFFKSEKAVKILKTYWQGLY